MTNNEAFAILDTVVLTEAIPAAKAVQMLRDWKSRAIDPEQVIDVLGRLTPSEVMDVKAFAERKLARRNRR